MKNYLGFRESVIGFTKHMLEHLFPNHIGSKIIDDVKVKSENELDNAKKKLRQALSFVYDDEKDVEANHKLYFDDIETAVELINTDIKAGYEGDPAATSEDEVILCYPAFMAISIYRLAHPLYKQKVKLIPRLMTEYAHGKTGIDIHPGATIGKSFFIDHGTGVVIGETTVIGDNVKLYQNVTLGAKSFATNDDGTLVKGIKRHPNIGNNVVIYAGATILGGDTTIGDNAVIGGNTWITNNVEASAVVKNKYN